MNLFDALAKRVKMMEESSWHVRGPVFMSFTVYAQLNPSGSEVLRELFPELARANATVCVDERRGAWFPTLDELP